MTENELKGLWCPFARGLGRAPYEPVHSRGDNIPSDGAHCIGSRCAACRTMTLTVNAQDDPIDLSKPVVTVTAYYCGLAGAPTT